jgi:hypothetical protein
MAQEDSDLFVYHWEIGWISQFTIGYYWDCLGIKNFWAN